MRNREPEDLEDDPGYSPSDQENSTDTPDGDWNYREKGKDKNEERLIQDYAKAIPIISPHLKQIAGRWYLFEQEREHGKETRIHSLNPDGTLVGCGPYATLESMRKWGWAVTPLIVFEVDTRFVR